MAFSNNAVKDKEKVKNGYEKVLKARLEDALFFYEEDLKHNLEEFYPKLEGVLFHQKLGSMLDKVKRNGEIAEILMNKYPENVEINDLQRANKLSKCDLLTEMVKEFDELQGIMGMHYALKQGEKEEVAKAIYEHYLPKTSDDDLPSTDLGTLLALADKLDTVISFLSIGEKPKGASDPYGIRRNAIGIIRIVVEKGLDINIEEILKEIQQRAKKSEILRFAKINADWENNFSNIVIPEVLEFLKGRFISYMKDMGFDTDIINAVLATGSYNFYRNYLKIKTLQQLKSNPDFDEIITVFKRVGRIIPADFQGTFSEELLKESAEINLYENIKRVESDFNKDINDNNYEKALEKLLQLKPYIDEFFDNVMVMVEDKKLRENRLSLMRLINNMFKKIADFTKITT